MKFKKLIMTGFKSFADRTEFDFGPGMTGLVGPNGCGKSNVVDGIKWVLGEQRPTSLRSKEMGDVIFNGNATRKSMGFCEVALVCDNSDRLLPLDADEVVVQRRVYRDGKSEYLINKKPSLLRNVKELFMGTGIGMDNYSVIEQGKLERLLASNPADRRAIFEEAAGISKYRLRRKETERKLEHTEQNLLRLRDVIDELEKRINSVRRQAAKAKRYKEIQGELQQMQTTLAMRDYKQHSEELASVEADLEQLTRAQTQVVTTVDGLEASLARADERLLELENEIAAKGRAQFDHDQVITQCEERIRANRETIAGLQADEEDGLARIEELRERLEELENEIASQDARLHAVDAEVEAAERAHAAALEAMGRRDEEHRAHLHAIDAKKDEMFNVERNSTELRNRLERERRDREAAEAGLERHRERRDTHESRERALQEESAAAEAAAQESSDEVDVLSATMRELDQRREAAERRHAALTEEVDTLKQAVASTRSRLDVLRDFKTRLEGVGQGVKAVLAEENRDRYPGLQGLLADAFDVDMEYAAAVQAALGERALAVLSGSREQTLDNLRALCAAEAGHATFLSPEWLPAELPARAALTGEGVVGNAYELIRPRAGAERVLEALLGTTVVVNSLDSVSLHPEALHKVTFVTLAGDVVHKDGALSGGVAEGPEIVVQRVELQTVESDLDRQEIDCREREASLQSLTAEREVLAADIKRTRQEIYEKNITLLERRNAAQTLRKDLDAVRSELEADRLEVEELQGEVDRGLAAERDLQRRLDESNSLAGAGTATLAELKDTVAAREAALHEARELVTRRKVEITQVVSSRDAINAGLMHQRTERTDKEQALESLQDRIEDNRARRDVLSAEIGDRETSIAASMQSKNDLEGRLLACRKERDELRETVTDQRGQVRELQKQGHEVEERLSSLRVQETQLGMQIENLKLRMMEEYQIDLTHAIRDFKPEEQEGVDWEKLRGLVNDYRDKLRALGNVNLESLEELTELETRYEFLHGQEQDLAQAKESMLEVIARIDEKCKEMFTQTFDAVKENFKTLFRRSFGGGKGDLVLLDPENVLDSGIDIIARPPGKLPKSLNLLSGGEKAMTTVALMFAIFQIRPAPFCILDEVDAPLDENNIDRFIGLVRGFLDVSQFLIITHSKRTMSSADILYGVTQQESGVSKKIAVHFEEEAAAV